MFVQNSTVVPLVEVIAENTRRLRGERGWSQERLARAMEMSRETVRSIEAGTGLTVGTLDRLAQAFGVGLGELLTTRVKREARRAKVRLHAVQPPILALQAT